MIYITGDTHGGIDMRKLLLKEVTGRLTAQDHLIICGDFGFIWQNRHESMKEKKWLKWFSSMPWTTLFIDGNHENFPRLSSYPQKEWRGGHIHEIRPNVLHLMRSQIFTIEGNTIFTLGGAASHDRGPSVGDPSSIIGKGWWPEEIPSQQELDAADAVLEEHGRHVDYIVTHCLPTSMQTIVKGDAFPKDALTEYLQHVKDTVTYEHWYCGHYHKDLDLCHNTTVLFSRVIPLGCTVSCSAPMNGNPIYHVGDQIMYLRSHEVCCGTILHVFPWGKMRIQNQPAYELQEEKEILAEDQILGYSI
jgi:hypothetical protein